MSVSVDGGEEQNIAFAPYIADLGVLDKGEHVVHITCFGNRVNTLVLFIVVILLWAGLDLILGERTAMPGLMSTG